MNTANFIACMLPVLALAAMPHIVLAQHPKTNDDTATHAATYQDAVKAFREQRYPAAYARFARSCISDGIGQRLKAEPVTSVHAK